MGCRGSAFNQCPACEMPAAPPPGAFCRAAEGLLGYPGLPGRARRGYGIARNGVYDEMVPVPAVAPVELSTTPITLPAAGHDARKAGT